jgi:hypothetical protein
MVFALQWPVGAAMMRAVLKLFAVAVGAFLSLQSFAWDGYDYEKGGYVEIEKGQLVRPGRDIEIYDYNDGRYKDVEVESIRRTGRGKVEVEVTDSETGASRTLEMDGD